MTAFRGLLSALSGLNVLHRLLIPVAGDGCQGDAPRCEIISSLGEGVIFDPGEMKESNE